jgi:hypothetical protein
MIIIIIIRIVINKTSREEEEKCACVAAGGERDGVAETSSMMRTLLHYSYDLLAASQFLSIISKRNDDLLQFYFTQLVNCFYDIFFLLFLDHICIYIFKRLTSIVNVLRI